MPWKTTEAGELARDDNGNPLFITDGGEEKSADYAALLKNLSTVTAESVERKKRLREMEERYRDLDGVDDIAAFVAAARRNADAVEAMSAKEKDAEAAAQARIDAATGPLKARIAEIEKARDDAVARWKAAQIESQFGLSAFVRDETVNPAMVKELFARHCEVTAEGNVEVRGMDGKVIFDESGPAGFESGMRALVAASPYRDILLKGARTSGSGSGQGTTGAGQNGTAKRYADCRTAEERAAWLRNPANLRR